MITDEVRTPMRIVVAAATGIIRSEIAECFDEDFVVLEAPDDRAAAEHSAEGLDALIVVADDLVNCAADELVQRVRLSSGDVCRVPVLWLNAHGEAVDLLSACQAGSDDLGRWPIEPDMMRARVRSLVRVALLESSMTDAAESGRAALADLLQALGTSTHLINNAVAGISGRAQLAALTGAQDDAGLVPVCLTEARRLSLVLAALHRLSESLVEEPEGAVRLVG